MKLLFSSSLVLLTFVFGNNASPLHQPMLESASQSLSSVDATITCPPGYTQPDNSGWTMCYKIFSDFKMRNDASLMCKNDNGSLASVPNAFVNSYLYTLATDVGTTAIWLGIDCLTSNPSSCTNDDYTNFVYNTFYPGQPSTVDICVYMSALGRDSQQWISYNCDQTFQFACELPAIMTLPPTTTPVPTTTTTVTTTTIKTTTKKLKCPKNYSKFNGMCYAMLYTDHSQTRSQQKATCKEVTGGNLASIPNSDVNDFIGSLGCSQRSIRIGLTCPNPKHDGDTSSCKWDDGTKFKYNAFATGDPNAEDVGDCPYLSNGRWYDNVPCESGLNCAVCQAPLQ